MAILAGIDEAGYGPLLGPLIVTGVAFDVPDASLGDCLWKRLRRSISKRASSRSHRLPILDSKKLFHRKDGIATLERTALVMSAAADLPARSFREFLRTLAPNALDDLHRYPWYRNFDPKLPTSNDELSLRMQTNAVANDMRQAGVRLIGIYVEPLLEGQFNQLVDSTRNKAVVSMGLVLRLIARIAAAHSSNVTRVVVDRQGGRSHYGPALRTAFDCRHLDVLAESDAASAYQFQVGSQSRRIEFITGGEDHHLPIALSSVISKYLRELFMTGFNEYWMAKAGGLRPTAGYYQDAKRFLADIDPILRRERIDRSLLVRSR